MEIKINNVNHIYNEFTPFAKKALDNINLSLESEKIIGIIGKAGSGKTTLVELLNALIIPSYGNVQVADFNIQKNMRLDNINKLRRKIGLVFQFPEDQFFNPTVREEVSFALKTFSYKSDRLHKQVSESLKLVGLDDNYLERKVSSLSGGEKRKVAIASVMVFNPKVLVLDEPTVGLDYKSQKKLLHLLKKLRNRYKKTVIIVSHDVDMLNLIADDIIVMDKGKVVASGTKREVFKNTSLFEKYGLNLPKIVEFIGKVRKEKGIKLGNHTDVKDLIKDIYRNV
ncbi:MAG: ATP-binding cassette domain-containing protein [Bacilli bacterium]|nr:ATP-binding cassette domain-containing protein [Bacilli bacterium]MDD3304818.1 ATP-binding cassette domain-containing protein [Bacilli bacterium]MDD4053405.1 ATP-binding cassette domain-containing protein [Bacilli bacterium]MDD4410948.1 ATP-binding cassette domain-containing protein [Bacilli bacterium]